MGSLTQVLADGTNTYLYGVGRIGEEQPEGWLYHHGDALGSVRQLTDPIGEVSLVKSYQPYGEGLGYAGSGYSSYGFTGEMTDLTGLVYLRARFYAPYLNQFIQPDPIVPSPYQPLGWNRFIYSKNNPIRFTDPSGLTATDVPCDQIWLSNMRQLCEIANEDPDINPSALDAREDFFWWIVGESYLWSIIPDPWGGEGYRYAGEMLRHFLNNSTYIRVDLGGNTRFDDDPGIMRATWKSVPAQYPDEPTTITPLLYTFLKDYIQPNLGCDTYRTLSSKRYRVTNNPRPQTVGWWGAFGHVDYIDAEYTNITILRSFGGAGIIVRVNVNYHVSDEYEWFGGEMMTPLPLGYPNPGGNPPFHFVPIPHEWEDSLVAANRASEYDFDLNWSDYFQILLPNDFSQFLPFGKSGWIPLD